MVVFLLIIRNSIADGYAAVVVVVVVVGDNDAPVFVCFMLESHWKSSSRC